MSLVIAAAVDAAFERRLRGLLPAPFDDTVKRWDGLLSTDTDVGEMAKEAPAVVILGPELAEDAVFELARRFDRDHPSVCVLIVTEPAADTWRKAVAAGVRGVIAPSASDDEWRAHLEGALDVARRRVTGAALAPARPRMITVISPKGGAGKTIVSTNLAVGLALRSPGKVVLIDLDLQFGDVAYALGLTPQHTMAEAASALDDLDATTLKVFLTRHQSGLYVLCAPAEPAEAEEVTTAAACAIFRLLGAEFRYVVVDTASGLGEHTLAALELSTDIILVSDMDVPSVRNLRKALDALDLLGMRAPRRHFVLNRADSRVGLDKEDVAAAAGIAIDVELPSSRRVPLSLNAGMPLVLGSPRSPMARRIAQLVERLERSPGAPGGGARRTP